MVPEYPVIVRDWRGVVVDSRHPDYWRQGRRVEAPAWPAQDPPPEVTTRDLQPEGAPKYPSAVVKLQRAAERAGWPVASGYSRGPERAVRVGEYKLMETFGVYVPAHPATGWRFGAVYGRTVGTTGWKWRSIAIRRPGHLIGPGMGVVFIHATITDLYEWMKVYGDVGTPWFKAVQARVEEQAERARGAARNRTAKPKEGQS
jgi:hypothetical protein